MECFLAKRLHNNGIVIDVNLNPILIQWRCMLCINFAGTLTSFKQHNMSKHHKGGSRGKKGSNGRSRQATVEAAPVTSNVTQTLVGGEARNPERNELKAHHGHFALSEKGDGGGQQADPSGVDCSQPVRPDGNGEKKQANNASHLVAGEAPGFQTEHTALSDSTMTVFGTSFLCACLECQDFNPVLNEMFLTHPKKEYFIGQLKKQRAEHNAKRAAVSTGLSPQVAVSTGLSTRVAVSTGLSPRVAVSTGLSPQVAVSTGLSPRAAEFKPHEQISDIQAVSDCTSAENHPRCSLPSMVSSVHVLILIKGTKSQDPGHYGY
jgi:hypothetical protein